MPENFLVRICAYCSMCAMPSSSGQGSAAHFSSHGASSAARKSEFSMCTRRSKLSVILSARSRSGWPCSKLGFSEYTCSNKVMCSIPAAQIVRTVSASATMIFLLRMNSFVKTLLSLSTVLSSSAEEAQSLLPLVSTADFFVPDIGVAFLCELLSSSAAMCVAPSIGDSCLVTRQHNSADCRALPSFAFFTADSK